MEQKVESKIIEEEEICDQSPKLHLSKYNWKIKIKVEED